MSSFKFQTFTLSEQRESVLGDLEAVLAVRMMMLNRLDDTWIMINNVKHHQYHFFTDVNRIPSPGKHLDERNI